MIAKPLGDTRWVSVLYLRKARFNARSARVVARRVGPPQAVQEITRLTTIEWARANTEGDVAWFGRHLADELMMTTGRTGRVTSKGDELAAVLVSTGGGGSEKIDDLKVHVYDRVAVTTFKIDTTGTDNTGPYHRLARYTEVWVHRDGRWQLVASHSSLLPESEAP